MSRSLIGAAAQSSPGSEHLAAWCSAVFPCPIPSTSAPLPLSSNASALASPSPIPDTARHTLVIPVPATHTLAFRSQTQPHTPSRPQTQPHKPSPSAPDSTQPHFPQPRHSPMHPPSPVISIQSQLPDSTTRLSTPTVLLPPISYSRRSHTDSLPCKLPSVLPPICLLYTSDAADDM
eukprot:1968348-Rhodomonas_salina.1